MEGTPASENYSGGFLNSLMLKDLKLASELALIKNQYPYGQTCYAAL